MAQCPPDREAGGRSMSEWWHWAILAVAIVWAALMPIADYLADEEAQK